MPINLRIILVVVSFLTAFFMIRKLRKTHFVIEDTIFWVFFSFLLLILSLFPQICYFFAGLLGFDAPSNFIFVVFIFLLLTKIFLMSVKISKLETKLTNVIQKYAIDHQTVKKDND